MTSDAPAHGDAAETPAPLSGAPSGRAPRPGPTRSRAARAGVSEPARPDSVRRHNLSLALDTVLEAGRPLSRAEIAASTGLTRGAVSALVDRLMAAGLLVELEPVAAQRAGRPAVPLAPARGTIAAIGMEVNVDYLGVRALDLAGRSLIERVELGDFRGSDPAGVLHRLGGLAESVIATLTREDVRVVGTALALPGLVDRVTGPLRVAPNLGWRDVDVVGLLAARPPLAEFPPRLANEANLGARAELVARRGSDLRSFVYVSGEVGIGGAIVLDGEIFPGRFGWSGEIGHTVLGTDPAGAGGGRLEDFAGQDALLARAGLPRHTPIADLVAAAGRDDPAAVESLRVAGESLGVALANVINIVDIGHVVLGGVYARLASFLEEPILGQCRARVLSDAWSPVCLSVAAAGDYPAMSGAAIAVLRALCADPVVLLGR